jgi:hypothetical protein
MHNGEATVSDSAIITWLCSAIRANERDRTQEQNIRKRLGLVFRHYLMRCRDEALRLQKLFAFNGGVPFVSVSVIITEE